MKIQIFYLLIGAAVFVCGLDIDENLKKELSKNGVANILVSFIGGDTRICLKNFEPTNYTSTEARIQAVTTLLQENAKNTQSKFLEWLTNATGDFKFVSVWISNQVYIKSADQNLVESISVQPNVGKITKEIVVPHIDPSEDYRESLPIMENVEQHGDPYDKIPFLRGNINPRDPLNDADWHAGGATWGLKKMRVPNIWNLEDGAATKGAGIRIGGIDSGVQLSHEALQNNFLGEYGWLDAVLAVPSPCDEHGHGTHTMGTAVGGMRIGVAPDASWMACRACYNRKCEEHHLLTCGQFMMNPTESAEDGAPPRPDLAPHVVLNSWGTGDGSRFFDSVIEAWYAAGIVPIFSNGNRGPNCGTTSAPGDHPLAISVGNATPTDGLHEKSSKGPSLLQNGFLIKPDLSAPGTAVISAFSDPNNKAKYCKRSGTSMAAAHVAGVAALLLSKKKDLTISDVKQYLMHENETNLEKPGGNCGNISEDVYPNNAFGSGRIVALNSFQKLLEDMNRGG